MIEERRYQHRVQKLSRFLSLLLRHQPARFPVKMDAQGYADLEEIMRILHALPNFRWVTYQDIQAVLNLPGRQRFEIVVDEDGRRRIRALYGHSAVRPIYEPVEPPAVLYHGTSREKVTLIQREGLRPMRRQYVHLTADPHTAHSIALRHARNPVILKIDAASAYAAGQHFYHPADEIYLSDVIPPEFIELLP